MLRRKSSTLHCAAGKFPLNGIFGGVLRTPPNFFDVQQRGYSGQESTQKGVRRRIGSFSRKDGGQEWVGRHILTERKQARRFAGAREGVRGVITSHRYP